MSSQIHPTNPRLVVVLWPWCLAWIAVSAFILAGIVAADQRLALWIHDQVEPSRLAYLLIRVPEAIAGVTILGTLVLGAWHLLVRRLCGKWHEAFLACLGICVALAAKAELKLLFGRVSPETWLEHQSAPFRSFHMLHAGSFPSGHMVILGVLAAFAQPYGQAARLLWLLLCLVVGAALMIAEAHYLTDLAAGMLLGVTIGGACRTLKLAA